jgi:hypothetical protein
MFPAGNIVVALYHKLQTQSSTPKDGRNYSPKHAELIGINNKTVIVASSWLSIFCSNFIICNHLPTGGKVARMGLRKYKNNKSKLNHF